MEKSLCDLFYPKGNAQWFATKLDPQNATLHVLYEGKKFGEEELRSFDPQFGFDMSKPSC